MPNFKFTYQEEKQAYEFAAHLLFNPSLRSTRRADLERTFDAFLTDDGEPKIDFRRALFVMAGMNFIRVHAGSKIEYNSHEFPHPVRAKKEFQAKVMQVTAAQQRQANGKQRPHPKPKLEPDPNSNSLPQEEQPPPSFSCDICSETFDDKMALNQHLLTDKHRMRDCIQFLEGPKAGMYISMSATSIQPFEFPPVSINETTTMRIYLHNTGEIEQDLVEVDPTRLPEPFRLINEKNQAVRKLSTRVKIPAHHVHYVDLQCSPKSYGNLRFVLKFQFSGPFILILTRTVKVVDRKLEEELKPISEFKKKKIFVPKATDGSLVPGEKPPSNSKVKMSIKLEKFEIPKRLRHASKSELQQISGRSLHSGNHRQHLSDMLFLEEIQMEKDICQYALEDVKMKFVRKGFMLKLDVPGLAEKRPSVLVGDAVVVYFSDPNKPMYEGYVHVVERDHVLLRFSPSFHHNYKESVPVNVKFSFNRTPLRRAHQALMLMEKNVDVLFPSSDPPAPALNSPLSRSELKNKNLNDEQVLAVQSILAPVRVDEQIPFIIFGPPGTGKTMTVIEAIKQIHARHYDCFVLASAPSNSAADLIVQHLQNTLDPSQLLRLNAFNRPMNDCPKEIMPYCIKSVDGVTFDVPTVQKAKGYKVIVATCATAGLLYSLGVGPKHFTHIFIDEAGQASEPECLISLGGLITKTTRIVLAGDPQQLGPVIRSPHALAGGLPISFLERIWKTNPYRRDPDSHRYPSSTIVKLVHNYRSHPAILDTPSRFFYDSELIASGQQAHTHLHLKAPFLSNPVFPVIFHCIEGKDQREGDSPSWFNIMEVAQVKTYVNQILDFKKVGPKEIGIITPYRKQVKKISQALHAYINDGLKVGSVEEFQGQERPVIIISTVRSSHEFQEFDAQHNLGFLKNPKRFNVAVTRAQSLLIVVGNPYVLSKDSNWNEFIMFCQKNKSLVGSEFTPQDEEKLLETYRQMKGEEPEEEESESISQIAQQEDPRWKVE